MEPTPHPPKTLHRAKTTFQLLKTDEIVGKKAATSDQPPSALRRPSQDQPRSNPAPAAAAAAPPAAAPKKEKDQMTKVRTRQKEKKFR
jgi:hypothetical protein